MQWPTATLENIAPAKASDWQFSPEDSVWHLTLDQIESHTGRVIDKKVAPVSEAGSSTYVFDENNVLYSKLRPYLNKVVCPTESGIATSELVPFKPRKDILDRKFLMYYLRSNQFLGFSNVAVAGVKMPRIIMEKLRKHQVPLPPISEQRRIVEILDQADELRKKRVEADKKAERILPALFYKMFGDPSNNLNGLKSKTLSDMGATVRYGLGQPPKSKNDGIALIRATNISRGTITSKNMIYVDPEDIPVGRDVYLKSNELIVVRSGAYTGDVAQITDDWEGCIAGYDLIINPGDCLTGEFLETYLLTPIIQNGYFLNLKVRAGQPHLNADQVSNTPIPEVSYVLQNKFSEATRLIRFLKKRQKNVDQNLNKIFNLLLYRAYSSDLTATWREVHMKELLAEMEEQSKRLQSFSLEQVKE